MVVDTSILLAIHFAEERGEWAADQLMRHRDALRMSTVNLSETIIVLRDRQPQAAAQMEAKLLSSGILFRAPDVEQARVAARRDFVFR